jgi:hypothetical protein
MLVPSSTLALLLSSSTALASPDLDVIATAALGDEPGEQTRALDLDRDGNIVLVGGDRAGGLLLRLDPSGLAAGPALRFDVVLDDVAVDRGTGNVAVLDAAGRLRMLGPDLEALWERPLGSTAARRLALGERGSIAVLGGGALDILAQDGLPLARVAVEDRGVAVFDATGLVVTTGSTFVTRCGEEVERATLVGFGLDGAERWHAFDDAEQSCEAELAATRGVDVARGDDGMIYLLAEVEAGADPFAGSAEHPWRNASFDVATQRAKVSSSLFAYYARFATDGEHVIGQYLGFDDELSVVQPGTITADRHGNVHVTGITTHSLAEPDEVAGEAEIVDALDVPSSFYQVVAADFDSRLAWRQLGPEPAHLADLALLDGAAITLVQPTSHGPAAGGTVVVEWPEPSAKQEKRPEREDVGTFGYESGISGVDPTCYCDSGRRQSPWGTLLLTACIALVRPRRRSRQSRS